MGNIKIHKGSFDTKLELEHASVVAGFPSPAEDYVHDTLDFNRDYIRHPRSLQRSALQSQHHRLCRRFRLDDGSRRCNGII